jgi:hypothetical protein
VDTELVSSWGSGNIPASAAPDHVGAFRFICNAAHVAKADPIVYPGQPGKGHLHQFFGNTATDANSTYESLRKTGQSTCNSPLNRSAYWMPAMMNGNGQVVRPDYVQIYYKRRPISDPNCDPKKSATAQGICVNLPRGLRFIFGYDMLTAKAPTGKLRFSCLDAKGIAAYSGGADIVSAATGCVVGGKFEASITAPDCWDGKNLDSPNHRDHMSYGSYGGWGYLKCPDTHPYVVPTFVLAAFYTVDADLNTSGTWDGTLKSWHLSSDDMSGMAMKPGSTFHTDWFGAWDDTVMQMWTDNCINKLLNCSGGDLGNGKQLKMFSGFSWNASPRLVPAP